MSTPPITEFGQASRYANSDPKTPYVDFLVVNNALLTATSTSQAYYIGGAKTLELINVVGTAPLSGQFGNITFKLNVVEPSSNTTVATYAGNVISTTGSSVIIVNNTISSLGDTVSVTWTVVSTSGTPSWNSVYSRLIAKV